MDVANKLELHYYLNNNSHQIDALIRNRCEAEILAIISEVSSVLGIESKVIAEAAKEGGFREFWKLIQGNSAGITVVILIVQLLVSTAPLVLESENEDLENELHRLQIEDTKLNIEKLRKQIKEAEPSIETVSKASAHLSKNLKIIKRKSNFYSALSAYQDVSEIGLSVLNSNFTPTGDERKVPRRDFRKFVLSSNKLKSEEIEADIAIVSPVLEEGRYKWKGIYNEQSINFDMLDLAFKDMVLIGNIQFQHGTNILAVLRISRELDEVGEVKITGYAVTTVIEKRDHVSTHETQQGKKYRHAKKYMEGQGKLFT